MAESHDWTSIKREFDDNGFVRVPAFTSPDLTRETAKHLDRFIREWVPVIPANEVYYEIDGRVDTIKSITTLSKHDPFFHELYNSEPFLHAAAVLLGGPATPPCVHLLNKPANVGPATKPHQDAAYLTITPGQSLTFWLALEPADAQNGAMIYLRGSHHAGLRPHHNNGSNYFAHEIADYDGYDSPEEVAVCAEPGDLLRGQQGRMREMQQDNIQDYESNVFRNRRSMSNFVFE